MSVTIQTGNSVAIQTGNRVIITAPGPQGPPGGGGGSGDVVGPSSSTDNAIARFNLATGKLIQNSGITIADGASGTLNGTNTGDQTIALTGDVTGSGTGTFAATIADNAVTFAKMQNISSEHLIGRHSNGSGDPQQIGLDGGLEFSGSNIRREALTGDVTAPAGSNTTTLANTAVTPGAYTRANVTVDSKGRITAAEDGAAIDLSTEVTGTLDDAYIASAATWNAKLDANGDGSALTGITAAQVGAIADGDTLSTGLVFPITNSLRLLDSSGDHKLSINAGEELTADRGLNFVVNDGSRTVNLSGNLTVSAAATVSNTNSGDVTLAGTPDYITLSGQVLTRNAIDLAADVTGILPIANIATGTPDGTKFVRDDGTLAVPAGGIGGSTGSTDNAILRANGTGGATLQSSAATINDSGNIKITGSAPSVEINNGTKAFYFYSLTGIGRIGNNVADIIQCDTGLVRVVGNIEVDSYAKMKQITTPPAILNSALIYSKDVSGTAEMFVMDEAGNETQISPHNHTAPAALIDSAFDEVGYSANYYTGIITWTNRTRETAGKPNSRQFETFDECNARLSLSGDAAMAQWDWDEVQAGHVAKREEERAAWAGRKAEWDKRPENDGKPFAEAEPETLQAKPKPQWLVEQLANRLAFLAERTSVDNLYPPAPMWQVKVWMVRNGIDLASIPGIMAASIPAGPELQEALVRWETAPLVPFDNALVGLIAGALKVSKEVAWSEIRAI